MTPYIEKASQKIVDIFFEKGAVVSRKEYDEVKATLSEQAELYKGCVEGTENRCVYEDGVEKSPEYGEVESFRQETLNRMEKI